MSDRRILIAACSIVVVVGAACGTRALGVHAASGRGAVSIPTVSRSVMAARPEAEIASQSYRPSGREPAPRATPLLKLDAVAVRALADRCAPAEPAAVLAAIVGAESGGHPLRIRVNGFRPRVFEPASADAAAALAEQLIGSGASVDLGLAQVNSRNLAGLGLDARQVLDPCRNLQAAGIILSRSYRAALQHGPERQSLLQTAYSYYNTGRPERGVANGYAASVEAWRRADRGVRPSRR